MSDVVIAALVGLIGGVIGSLVAPWVQWATQKRQIQMANRKQMIDECRKVVEYFDFDNNWFGHTVEFSRLQPYLDKKIADYYGQILEDQIPAPEVFEYGSSKVVLLDQLARIEKEWGLV